MCVCVCVCVVVCVCVCVVVCVCAFIFIVSLSIHLFGEILECRVQEHLGLNSLNLFLISQSESSCINPLHNTPRV